MSDECKFKKSEGKVGCEGGHTTAQHHMSVCERIIKQECGVLEYYAIKEAVDDAKKYKAIVEQVHDFLVVDFIAVENGDYQAALGKAVAFNTQVHLDSRVNGGSVMLDPDEVGIVNKLLAGYVVGPEGQKVLDKLRQTS